MIVRSPRSGSRDRISQYCRVIAYWPRSFISIYPLFSDPTLMWTWNHLQNSWIWLSSKCTRSHTQWIEVQTRWMKCENVDELFLRKGYQSIMIKMFPRAMFLLLFWYDQDRKVKIKGGTDIPGHLSTRYSSKNGINWCVLNLESFGLPPTWYLITFCKIWIEQRKLLAWEK